MDAVFTYSHPSSAASILIKQQLASPIEHELRRRIFDLNNYDDQINTLTTRFQRLNINHDSSSLDICFSLHTHDLYWYRPAPQDTEQFQGRQTHIKSLYLKLNPSVYMSYDTFYSVMQANLDNWGGDEFDWNYRHVVIHGVIHKVGEIVNDESKKSLQHIKVFVRVTLDISHFIDERISSEQGSLPLRPRFFNRMVPARKSSMQLLQRTEADENMMNDNCVICFEELGKEKELLCMPCVHIFNGDCITKWLQNGHCCPICRYKMPTN